MDPLYSYISYKEPIPVHTDVQQRTSTEMERREQTASHWLLMFFVSEAYSIENAEKRNYTDVRMNFLKQE